MLIYRPWDHMQCSLHAVCLDRLRGGRDNLEDLLSSKARKNVNIVPWHIKTLV